MVSYRGGREERKRYTETQTKRDAGGDIYRHWAGWGKQLKEQAVDLWWECITKEWMKEGEQRIERDQRAYTMLEKETGR